MDRLGREELQALGRPLGDDASLDALIDRVGDARIVMLDQPERERGNYVPTILPLRYDAFLHIDETRAVRPLHVPVAEEQMPETFPWGV